MEYINFILKSSDGQIITIFEQRENSTLHTLLRTIDVCVHNYFPIYNLKYGDIIIGQNNESLDMILSQSLFSNGGEIIVAPVIRLNEEKQPEQKHAIDWNEIEKIQYNPNTSFNQTSCAICFTDFKQEETIINIKNCKHIFHEECIIPWLEKSYYCPLCRGRASQIPHEDPCPSYSENIDELLSNLLSLI